MASTYTTTLARSTDTTVAVLVRKDDGKTYGVTFAGQLVVCSCPDAMYRGRVCKHARLAVEDLRAAFLAAVEANIANPTDERFAAVEAASDAYSRASAWVWCAEQREAAQALRAAAKAAA